MQQHNTYFAGRWGDQRLSTPLNGGDHPFVHHLDRGDQWKDAGNFAQFCRPPAPVVNDISLTYFVLYIMHYRMHGMLPPVIFINKKIKVGKKLHFCVTLKPVRDNIPTDTSGMSSLVRWSSDSHVSVNDATKKASVLFWQCGQTGNTLLPSGGCWCEKVC